MNKFTIDTDEPYEPLRVNPAIEAEQRARLEKLRAERGDISALAGGRPGGRARLGERPLPDEGGPEGAGHGRRGEHALRDVWGEYVPHDVF